MWENNKTFEEQVAEAKARKREMDKIKHPNWFNEKGEYIHNKIPEKTKKYDGRDNRVFLEEDEARLLYIAAMFFGSALTCRWLVWIAATILYLDYKGKVK